MIRRETGRIALNFDAGQAKCDPDRSPLGRGGGLRYVVAMTDCVSDAALRALLTPPKAIAVVGYSANPARPSHRVARFLRDAGFQVHPVNPGLSGQRAFGTVIYPEVAAIPTAIDIVDIFRRSEHVPAIVGAALDAFPGLSAVWMQLGVRNDDAAKQAMRHGVAVIQDRCPVIEYQRLFGPAC